IPQQINKPEEPNKPLTDITVITKTPINETPVEQGPKNETGKTIIKVDINMQPIEGRFATNQETQTSVLEPAIAVAEPKIVSMQPVFRQDIPERQSLRSQVESSIQKTDNFVKQNAGKDFNQRMEQIKKMKELMSTDEGLEQIINSHPTPENNYDLTQSFSAPKQQSSFSFNKGGSLGIVSNSALNAQVD
ncbi:MAG: hypothetical protein J6P97_06440, partial [Bacteroidales bacterium]|nr:hypothetical protein [Bacteroidales bacterium]